MKLSKNLNPTRILAGLIIYITISTINVGFAQSQPINNLLNLSAQISEKTLANGVRIIVKSDNRAPTVAHTVWYKVGSIDEPEGITGISHLLEHMMFKGTATVPAGQFSQKVSDFGGRENAFTSRDNTTYFQLIPKASLAEMMSIEADRMVNLKLNVEEFKKEREVVREERRLRTDDSPQSLFWERLMAFAYIIHPYRQPIIGWMPDIENINVEDLQAWYKNFYAPDNATVIIVGDVLADDVFALAEKTYGKIPARTQEIKAQNNFKAIAKTRQKYDLAHKGMRTINMKVPASLYSVNFLYHVPNVEHPTKDIDKDNSEAYAINLLAMILDGHSAARLPQKLVKDTALAVSIDTGYSLFARGPSLFIISGTPSEKTAPEKLAEAIRKQIDEIIKNGVSLDELKRAQKQLSAHSVYKLDSLFGQAREIGTMEILGFGYSEIEKTLTNIKNVTPRQIQEVAKKYLTDDNLTYGLLIPTKN